MKCLWCGKQEKDRVIPSTGGKLAKVCVRCSYKSRNKKKELGVKPGFYKKNVLGYAKRSG